MTASHETEHSSTESVARGVFAALDRRDLTGVASYLHEDDVQDFLPIGVRTGRSAVLAVFAELFAAIPDLRMEVEEVLVQGNKACVRWRLRGTFSAGSFQGIRATGRALDIRGVDAAIEVTDGLITRNTIFYDGAGFARAVGLLPAQGSPAERLLIGAFNLETRLVGLLRRRLGRPPGIFRSGRRPTRARRARC